MEVITKEQVDLIEDALAEFGHSNYPYCQSGISLEFYVNRQNIEEWLLKRSAGRTTDTSVFDTMRRYMGDGLTAGEAIQKVEGILHTTLPESIKDRIKEK